MKISTTGSAASTTPAQNGPHSCPNWSEMKPKSPTESVYFSGAWSRVEAMMYSFSVDTNDSRPITASTGAASGSTTPQKICAGVAPSTRADSSSSTGIVLKKPTSSQALTPSAPPR